MEIVDDRTASQKITHCVIIAGTDSVMSGWGKAKNGMSYAGWACRPDQRDTVFRWVSNRREMRRVREVFGDWRPRGPGHTHIYVVDEGQETTMMLGGIETPGIIGSIL